MLTARFLTADDMPVLRAFRLHALQAEPESFSSTYEREETHSNEQWIERWVVKNATAGIFDNAALVAKTRFYIDAKTPDTAELMSDYISPAYRGRGLYAALLKLCLHKFLLNPALRYLLRGFFPYNNVSRAVSARYGFKDIGTTEAALPDGSMATFALTGLNRDSAQNAFNALCVPDDVKVVM